MRGWKALLSKDWKLIFRNRLLLAVLIAYPFLIMGVIGAAFYDVGRPVPIGLVNLDRRDEGGVVWMAGRAGSPSGLERRIERRADGTAAYGSEEEAVAAIEAGSSDAVLAVPTAQGGLEWTGFELSQDDMERTVLELKEGAEGFKDYASAEEALRQLHAGTGDFVLGTRSRGYPYLGESIWIDDEYNDAAMLMERFSADVTEMKEFASEAEAREAVREGRVDAAIVLPRGFVHRLKTLYEVAVIEVILDQSNLVKAEFAETSIRGFLSRVKEEVAKGKMDAVVAGLYTMVSGGDFFGTEIVGLEQIRKNLLEIREALPGDSPLREKVQGGIDLADTVIGDIEDAASYLEGTALPIELDVSSVAGRPLSAKDAVVPSLIALSILWTGVLCGAILMVIEDEEGMRARLRLTRMGPFALVGSKLTLATAIVFVQSAAMLFIAVAAFGAFASNALLALLVIAAASFSCIGIGLVIAAFAREVAGAVILSVLVSFPLIFMTGAVFPVDQMPVFMQWIAHAIPLTYAIEALSGVMLRGEYIADVAWRIGALAAFGVALLGLGSVLVRRRGD